MRTSLLLVVFIGGCAAVDPREPMEAVQSDLQGRVGQMVMWRTGGAADREADSAVTQLLTREMTADDAVQVALLNNRNLQATYTSLGVAQADLVEAGLLKNPIFDAEFRFAEGGHGTGIDLGLMFEFLDVLYIPMRKSIAQANLEVAKRKVSGAVIDLAGEARRAYYDYQAALQTLELRKTVVASMAAAVDLAQRLHKAGNFTDLNLVTEHTLHEQSKLEQANAELEVLRLRERLNVLMGLWGPQTRWKAAARLADPDETGAPSDVEKRAIERSVAVAAGRERIKQASARLGIAKPLGWLSELELGIVGEREPEGEWSVGPAFALPIPIFSQGRPALVRGEMELREQVERHAALAVEIRSAARLAAARMNAAKQRVEFFKKTLLPLREQMMDQTQRQFNAMQIGAFQLLAAKREQIETGRAYIAALREYWLARADLELLLAGGMPRGETTGGAVEIRPQQTNDSH